MKRDNHYEVAFEAYLRKRGVATLPIVEARRSYLDDSEIKSPDFLVVGPTNTRYVVDVKGRIFPGRGVRSHMVWESWSPRSDVDGLARWAVRFGHGFRGILAFVYHILPEVELMPGTPDQFEFRDRLYLIRGVSVSDYRAAMRPRSPRWGTVHLTKDAFRGVIKPFSYFLSTFANQVEFRAE
ncbi:MAG TPA: HYExAFE family protein [Gemmata sp.]|jgi:hypothetical protein|nr:HYExAFE family protein [Gemmata sp.]